MKIKSLKCDQFAGLKDRDVTFSDGLNILVGENESGKSTLVDLMYQLLFKNPKLDGRSDADFIGTYFPKTVEGPQGDFIDGSMSFETNKGVYQIKKEWEKGDGLCRMVLPNGVRIQNPGEINRTLSEELQYGAGVYGEIIFPSQKRQQLAIASILKELPRKSDELTQTRDSLTSIVTRAALETGGVSLDLLEKRLQEKITALGAHWDFDADLPEGGVKRGIQNEWKKEVGLILSAYYAMERTRKAQVDADNAERAVETIKSEIRELTREKKELEKKNTFFQRFRGILEKASLLERRIEEQTRRKQAEEADLSKWPAVTDRLRKAEELSGELGLARIHDLFLRAGGRQKAFADAEKNMEGLNPVDGADRREARILQDQERKLQAALSGMDLVAKIKKLGDREVEIRSAATGEPLSDGEGEIRIHEAVEIVVPGILEMQLMPRGVDVEGVKNRLQAVRQALREIYARYGAENLEELLEKAEAYDRAKWEYDQAEMELKKVLGQASWEEISEADREVPEGIPTEAEVRAKIRALCGSRTVEETMGGLKATLEALEEKYSTREALKENIRRLGEEIQRDRSTLCSLDEIPLEFQGIEDPEKYDEKLRTAMEEYEQRIREKEELLKDAERRLEEKSAEEYSEELIQKESEFAERKAECEHWRNIRRVFLRLREECGGYSMQDIEEHFREYLHTVSGGRLALRSMDEKLNAKLSSGDHALTYEILSEGTRDTISLAFRLAMLEHLYPEGDGLAIFDDPFTDMSPSRVKEACRLIEKFAQKNQVIFITCDDKYRQLMRGNVIPI